MDQEKDTTVHFADPEPVDPVPPTQIEPAKRPVRFIVEKLDDLGRHGPVSIGHIIASFGRTSFLPMMLVPALMLVSPLSGIPLFSTFCGIWIILVALQRLTQRDRLWLPGVITKREIQGESLVRAVAALRRGADWLDRHSRPRLSILVEPPVNALSYLLCICAGLTIPFLELVPFSSSILGLIVLLVVVGLLVRDGVYVIVALVLAALVAAVPVFLVSQVVT